MKYLPLFICFIFYACNTNAGNTDTNADNIVGRVYSPTTMPDCPSLVPSSSSYEPQYNENGDMLIGGCGAQWQLPEYTFYFRKQGGFECVFTSGPPEPLNFYSISYNSNNSFGNEVDEECKSFLASYSYLDDNHNIVSVSSDYCKDNYCYVSAGIFSDPKSAPVMKRECSWHSVAHTSRESLLISVDKNETGKERSIYVTLGSFCSTRILTLIQSAE